VKLKNDHLGYAITWFGLAASLVAVFLAWAIRERYVRTS
jgi:surfeit locus 1 family protein